MIASRGITGAAAVAFLVACGTSPHPPDGSCSTAANCHDPALPYCVDSACAACDGASTCTADAPRCSPTDRVCTSCVGDIDCGTYPALPRCAPDGACVGCVTSSQCANPAPICDPVDRACHGCTSDDDCASAVCELATGACVAEASVLYASPSGSATATCDKADPCSLTTAIAAIDATRTYVKLAGGAYGAIGITGKTAAIHGLGATIATVSASDGAMLRLQGLATGGLFCTASPSAALATVELEHVTLGSIDARPGTVTARHSRFVPEVATRAIHAQDDGARHSTITVDRSYFEGGEGFCIIDGSTVHVTNSVIANLAPNQTAMVCNIIAQTAVSTFAFTTFYNAPLACSDGPVSTVVSSSIIVGRSAATDSVTGTKCELHYDLMFPQTTVVAGDHLVVGMDPAFVNAAAGDLHLMATSPAIDAADPMATPVPDIEGTERPQGVRGDIGAFEFMAAP